MKTAQRIGSLIFSIGLILAPTKASAAPEGTHVVTAHAAPVTEGEISSLKHPPGFSVEPFAVGLTGPRMIAVHQSGRVYVTEPKAGAVLFEGLATDPRALAAPEKAIELPHVHGIVFHGDTVYLATIREVVRATVLPDGRFGEPRTITADLPEAGQHPNRTLGISPDGRLLVTIGSTCNACIEKSPQIAAILEIDPATGKHTLFAGGLRNTLGFDWAPWGDLYGLDNGTDWLGDELPGEELNLLVQGGDYGWPYLYGHGKLNPLMPFNADALAEKRRNATSPAHAYTAHAAPLGFHFYRGSQFPTEYRGDAFATFHGSWNRQPPSGYEVVRVHFENHRPARFESFISGFLLDDTGLNFGRPCGIAESPDGSLFFTDDENGTIYRVRYAAAQKPVTTK